MDCDLKIADFEIFAVSAFFASEMFRRYTKSKEQRIVRKFVVRKGGAVGISQHRQLVLRGGCYRASRPPIRGQHRQVAVWEEGAVRRVIVLKMAFVSAIRSRAKNCVDVSSPEKEARLRQVVARTGRHQQSHGIKLGHDWTLTCAGTVANHCGQSLTLRCQSNPFAGRRQHKFLR